MLHAPSSAFIARSMIAERSAGRLRGACPRHFGHRRMLVDESRSALLFAGPSQTSQVYPAHAVPSSAGLGFGTDSG